MSAVLKSAVLTLLLACLPQAARATDLDGDGVDDSVDVCPNTPPGVLVDAQGRPRADLDDDCDGDLDDFAIFQSGFTGPLSPPEVCHDGVDNDLDGLTDCQAVVYCPAGTACGAHAACAPSATCECDPGWEDCDALYANGCETDLLNDPQHCGACGVVCGAVPNTVATACVNGQCVITACAAGYADCDALYANGCEVNTQTSPQHCGTCGVVCGAVPNTVSTACVNGQCVITACATGYADCNALFADGCETSLNDSSSCYAAAPLPSLFGDEDCEQFSSTDGRGGAWYRMWVNEGDWNAFVAHPLFFDAVLQPPTGVDYDLDLYDACGGNLLDSSTLRGSQAEQVEFTWPDNLGGDDRRELWIHVRYYSGSACGLWNLATYGGCAP